MKKKIQVYKEKKRELEDVMRTEEVESFGKCCY